MRVVGVRYADMVRTSGDYRETYVYREFYHGTLPPQGQNRYKERPYRPVLLDRNLAFDPAVVCPLGSVTMLLLRSLSEELGAVPCADYYRARLHKVYHHPADEASVRAVLSECSVFDDSFDGWREARARAPSADERASFDYVELIVPSLFRLGKQRRDLRAVKPRRLTRSGKPVDVATAVGIHREYPIVRDDGIYWFVEPLFAVIAPHVARPHVFALYEFDAP